MDPDLARFVDALNRHDLDAFVACFAEDYRSEQPQHPSRGFGGRAQVRENWAIYFRNVPNVRIDIERSARSGDVVWMECRIHGDRKDGTRLDLRGVVLNGMRGALVAWARLYLDEVEAKPGPTVTETVRTWAHGV